MKLISLPGSNMYSENFITNATPFGTGGTVTYIKSCSNGPENQFGQSDGVFDCLSKGMRKVRGEPLNRKSG